MSVNVRDDSGKCGENLTWFFNETAKSLTISGTGNMSDFQQYDSMAWYPMNNLIKTVIIHEGVTSIGDSAFYGVFHLESVTIPSTVKSIGSYSFINCAYVTSLTIPEGVVSIGTQPFQGCYALKSVTIPGSVTSIGSSPFDDCPNLETINVSSSNSVFVSDYGVLIDKVRKSVVQCPCKKSGDYTIPDYVTKIQNGAFGRCKYLTSVTIPEGVESIGWFAFQGCDNLTSISIPSTVTSIGFYCFESCSNLKSVVILGAITAIQSNMFYKCYSLSSFRVPDTVKTIEDSAFYGCSNLTSIVIPSNVSSIGNNAFSGCKSLVTVVYAGTSDPFASTSSPFVDCDALEFTCVPPGYNSTTFGGLNVSCKSLLCEALKDQHNRCFEAVSEGSECAIRKRLEAVKWENQTTGCVEYFCENDTGLLGKALCDSNSDDVCVNDKCVGEKDIEVKPWSVEIEINATESMSVTSEQIAVELSNLTGIGVNDITIIVEYDDRGRATTIIVYVNDKTTADVISASVNELDKNSETCEGVLCRTKGTEVKQTPLMLAVSSKLHISIIILMIFVFSFIVIV